MNYQLPWGLIKSVATEYNVDKDLLAAIVMTESSGNPKVMRYEPGYRYLVTPAEYASALGISHDTEITLQKMSYGLCQVMGGKAREQGFSGMLTDMLDPELCLKHGALFLRSLAVKHWLEVDVISSYNQGSPRKTPGGMYANQTYVDKVDKFLRQFRETK